MSALGCKSGNTFYKKISSLTKNKNEFKKLALEENYSYDTEFKTRKQRQRRKVSKPQESMDLTRQRNPFMALETKEALQEKALGCLKVIGH